MTIEIEYNGSIAICKINGKPFYEGSIDDKVFAVEAFRTVIKDWNRKRRINSRRNSKTSNPKPYVGEDKNDN